MSQMIIGCEIINAGPHAVGSSFQIPILLKQREGKPFDQRWFVAAPSSRKEILATALAAMAAGKWVNVEVDSLAEHSKITQLLMTRFSITGV